MMFEKPLNKFVRQRRRGFSGSTYEELGSCNSVITGKKLNRLKTSTTLLGSI